MRKLVQRPASSCGIDPSLIKGQQQHGLCYFMWPESNAVGAQCQHCHTIIWTNSRKNPALNAPIPAGTPECGEGYRLFYHEKIKNFLASIPACPNCGKSCHDRFINNVHFPRFEDGTEFDSNNGNVELISLNPQEVTVWWLEE
ncbi:MAG: hypothetical protein KA754_01080 [Corallincola sp.]|nr:hypothetical protein [Corallincola sp.]